MPDEQFQQDQQQPAPQAEAQPEPVQCAPVHPDLKPGTPYVQYDGLRVKLVSTAINQATGGLDVQFRVDGDENAPLRTLPLAEFRKQRMNEDGKAEPRFQKA
jgi:hypothetical protein